MTELALHQDNAPALQSDRPMRLVEWAEEARAAASLAQSLCQTPFAGQYRGDAMGATAAILKGAEVGLTPVTSLGAFDLIQGVVAPKAITLRALVQAHGHSVWIESSNDRECVAKATRRGEGAVHESRWTIARAAQMGLTSKANWKNQPSAMLMARATSEVCRLVAADVILGIGYSAEEVLDSEPGPTTTVKRSEPTKRTAQRAQAAPPVIEEPSFDEEPEPEQQPETGVRELASAPQLKKLHAMFSEAGITERESRLAYVNDVIEREVASSADLYKTEASQVIDALDAEAAK